jgi:uncharacterized protein
MEVMKQFSQAVCEKIGYYVYILKDPRTSAVFYVGKGAGNRVFQHVNGALTSPTISEKLNLIREIHDNDLVVEHYILRHGITQEQALEIESACIDLLGLDNLTNSFRGHNNWERGLKTLDEVVQHYDAQIITFVEPTIIININRLYRRFMAPQELYDATRSSWKVAKHRRETVKYAIASYRGLVREVYEIEGWNSNNDRWEFTGKIAENQVRDKYLNQSLDNYIKKGSQNPIKYSY